MGVIDHAWKAWLWPARETGLIVVTLGIGIAIRIVNKVENIFQTYLWISDSDSTPDTDSEALLLSTARRNG